MSRQSEGRRAIVTGAGRGIGAAVAQGRMATPEEIASAVVFLASDAAAAITGTDLTLDGGATANLYIVETLPAG